MKKPARLFYLLRLLEIGAKDNPVSATTAFLASMFEVSQQSASRIASELQDMGYLSKTTLAGTLRVKLTDQAVDELRTLRRELESAFETPGSFQMEGELFTGFGEGTYYMSKRQYRKQFSKRLGFDPYPGTFNLRITDPVTLRRNIRLRSLEGIRIEGFKDEERTYGGLHSYRTTIEGRIEGALIVPIRTAYANDIAELISPEYLRTSLNLEDGDLVNFEVHLLRRES